MCMYKMDERRSISRTRRRTRRRLDHWDEPEEGEPRGQQNGIFFFVLITVDVLPGDQLKRFVQKDDRHRNLQNSPPLFKIKRTDWEDGLKVIKIQKKLNTKFSKLKLAWNLNYWNTYTQNFDVQKHKVQPHRKTHGSQKPIIFPWRHHQQWLIFRETLSNQKINQC